MSPAPLKPVLVPTISEKEKAAAFTAALPRGKLEFPTLIAITVFPSLLYKTGRFRPDAAELCSLHRPHISLASKRRSRANHQPLWLPRICGCATSVGLDLDRPIKPPVAGTASILPRTIRMSVLHGKVPQCQAGRDISVTDRCCTVDCGGFQILH